MMFPKVVVYVAVEFTWFSRFLFAGCLYKVVYRLNTRFQQAAIFKGVEMDVSGGFFSCGLSGRLQIHIPVAAMWHPN